MIVSNLQNSQRIEGLHPLFKSLFDYVKTHDLLHADLGRIEVDGDHLFINNVNPECVTSDQQVLELHHDYIDVHILLEGEEMIGWKALEDLQNETKAYSKEEDCALYSDRPTTYVSLLPGQFVIVKIDEEGERIPLTICDYNREEGTITIVFQTVGASTERMVSLQEGDAFEDFVGPLGCPSDLIHEDIEELKKKKILFVAGGVGTAPVYPQVKWLHEHGVDCDVIMGSRNKDLLILEDEMKKVATNLYVTTDDGSYGFKGTGTAQLQELWDNGNRYDHCVAIGPMIMMKFVCKLTKELGIPTVVSMNPIMVDGTGMCGACRLVVGDEVKFACVDGPEFDGHLVDFDQAMRRQAQYKTEEGRAMLKLQEGATHHGGCGNCNS